MRKKGLDTVTVSNLSNPQRTFWQSFKSATWMAFKCWIVWFAAKGLFVLIYAANGGPFTPLAANVITVAALAVASAWYFWRYGPRRAGHLANAAERSDGGLCKCWKTLSKGTRGNIYLAVLIVVVFTLTNAHSCSVRGTACYSAINYSRFDAIPDFDSLPDEQFKNAFR